MAIPDYQTLMLPLLKVSAKGDEIRFGDAVELLADEFSLTEKERSELLPSGSQALMSNRVGWAKTYITKAGLLESTRRGFFRITTQGADLLAKNPSSININLLTQYPEFVEFRKSKKTTRDDSSNQLPNADEVSTLTPEDALADAYKQLQESIESEVLSTLKEVSPSYFEHIVVDVLVKMGYGGSKQDAGQALGRSGDGGIDGIINEDQLGLDVIYIQAKRWNDTVTRPEIQKFAGALQGQRARKGVFITTSSFSSGAEEYADLIESKIILIDGIRLAKLMVQHGIGVSTIGVYKIRKLDSDYFDES